MSIKSIQEILNTTLSLSGVNQSITTMLNNMAPNPDSVDEALFHDLVRLQKFLREIEAHNTTNKENIEHIRSSIEELKKEVVVLKKAIAEIGATRKGARSPEGDLE